jgi:membrane-associated HD superfamily phosphohydrolase
VRFYKFISIVFHPIVIPTIGILLYFIFTPINVNNYVKATVLAFIFITTYILPLFILILFKKLNLIKSFKAESIQERKTPVVIMIIIFYLLGSTFRKVPNLSDIGLLFYATCLGLICIYTLFSLKIKTSIHLLSIGITTGFFFTLTTLYNENLILLISLLLLLSGLMANARLHLKAHTEKEVYIGFFIGFVSPILLFYCL